ncbi:hypothetical protein SQW19_05555 [Stenotrophomonas acidaminiphila]|uniref:hypothetical protein n=1 Tax=Stenotrophomonas acidaminiphila TaxID=128780 RepID=UPI002ABD33C7|nr:hypothetical protein [Stenotrophomonas acidaminiphila]WPU57056.1 hypothetical protein SQW19_05555 [Stenotrophomonas acidaminiphila]
MTPEECRALAIKAIDAFLLGYDLSGASPEGRERIAWLVMEAIERWANTGYYTEAEVDALVEHAVGDVEDEIDEILDAEENDENEEDSDA